MKTINTTKILAALLMTTTLTVSGYAQSTTDTNVAVPVQFKTQIGADNIKNAVIAAAEENGWLVFASGQLITLKKNIEFKETAKNTRGRIWNKVAVSKEAVANIKLSNNSYTVKLADESEKYMSKYYSKKSLTNELEELESSIKTSVALEVL